MKSSVKLPRSVWFCPGAPRADAPGLCLGPGFANRPLAAAS